MGHVLRFVAVCGLASSLLLAAACTPQGDPQLAPREAGGRLESGADNDAASLARADIAALRAQYATPTPRPLEVAAPVPTPPPSGDETESGPANCEKWVEQVRETYLFVSYNKIGDSVEGALFNKATGERIKVYPGFEAGGIRVADLNQSNVQLAAGNCSVQLNRTAEIPTPEPVQELDANTRMLAGDTLMKFQQIATAMEEYFERNGHYPYPADQSGNPLEVRNPRAVVTGFIPPTLVERDVYLRSMPTDAFSGEGKFPFRYATIPAEGWLVMGNGPDRDADLNPQAFFNNWGDNGLNTEFLKDAPLYKPAGEGISNGDIIVWGPNGQMSLQAREIVDMSNLDPTVIERLNQIDNRF